MIFYDRFFLFSLYSIWIMLFYGGILTFFGYKYYLEVRRKKFKIDQFPFVSILVPAHNEEKVIEETVRSIMELNYPIDRFELIVIDDLSMDNTSFILGKLEDEFAGRMKVVRTNKENGGRGKANALNVGLKHAVGELIAVYDADNRPDKRALMYLVAEINKDDTLGAVIGKFRTINKNKNLLTRFINIEGLSFQWMAQGGRWRIFNLCTIPGTNFLVRRCILDKIGGWDEKAIAEDTEISIRIYSMGFKIKFVPQAVTYEQEPENLRVWFKQRKRWVKGNIYVVYKYLLSKDMRKNRAYADVLYFFLVYVIFLAAIFISDLVFILGILTDIKVYTTGNLLLIWFLAYIMFVLEVSISLSLEKEEFTFNNIMLIFLMYFTYCKLWGIVSAQGLYSFIKDRVLNREHKWYKTERF
ncbi:glycosyltransferase [Thermobrachium celere]|uniref:Dolichol-phosphate mannosyltransferase in lipid-linked oligosaccharide synthesis cluster n=1 Tax=Thermobrachium celere DSM 8682 TaxID=941824 RepID=R7RUT1_9CLOT|nr:glycosyltransferase [Thermobrachium celere]CDF59205.1 Dolichol-phosphate mannosyltransferase in lipid-linked oligosaccharide synthesis cluster [Thermobrachium celere DSM 8682]